MNAADARRFLGQTLGDLRLSATEKQALRAWISEQATTDQHRGVIRSAAFDQARHAVVDPVAVQVIDWLEDILRVLVPVEPSPLAGDIPTQSAACFAPGDACWRHIASRITNCRLAMDLCVFTITDDRLSHLILAAHRRGVRVRIITDDEKSLDPGSDISQFRGEGIPVKLDRIQEGTGANGHMHHKFAIFDGNRLINGSYNWTRSAADTNYENVIDTTDRKLVALFAAEFERLWKLF